MKKKLLLAALLSISSSSAFASITTLEEACSALSTENIKTRSINKSSYDGLFHCTSDYYEFDKDTRNAFDLSNNIAYYVKAKNKNKWDEIKIVVNINTPQKTTETRREFKRLLDTLSKVLGNQQGLDVSVDDLFSMIDEGKFSSPSDQLKIGYPASIIIDKWPNTGFEYRLVITK